MSLSASMNIGISGLAAAARQNLAASHNLANSLTSEFRPLSASQREMPGGGVTTDLFQEQTPPTSDPILDNTVSLMGSLYALKLNAVVVRTADQMLGTTLDLHA